MDSARIFENNLLSFRKRHYYPVPGGPAGRSTLSWWDNDKAAIAVRGLLTAAETGKSDR